MNVKKSVIHTGIYAAIVVALLVGNACAKKRSTTLQPFSIETPLVFDKESIKAQLAAAPEAPSLRVPQPTTNKERRVLRRQLETIIYRKDAPSLSVDELRTAADLCLQLGWQDKALLYLRQLLVASKGPETIKALKFEVAEILFAMGKIKEAEEAFSEYLEQYPGSERAEHAHYKKVLCLFYQTLKADQDQMPTRQAIQFAEAYLEKGLPYKQFRPQVAEIRKQCQLMLYESELNVFNFYMKKKSYGAASGRLAYLRKQYLPILPIVEPNLLSLECRLAQAQGNTKLYEQKLAQLQTKFPRHVQEMRVARGKRDYMTRF